MPRDARAYLSDVVESCEAIASATADMDLEAYGSNRLVRSAVEREFTIIGEAVAALSRIAPEVFSEITNARRIVDFRNQLAHEYPNVNDALVWGIVVRDVEVLRDECTSLLDSLEADQESTQPAD